MTSVNVKAFYQLHGEADFIESLEQELSKLESHEYKIFDFKQEKEKSLYLGMDTISVASLVIGVYSVLFPNIGAVIWKCFTNYRKRNSKSISIQINTPTGVITLALQKNMTEDEFNIEYEKILRGDASDNK